ncbi:uncharacterized protein [Macrobrachium rosenbergii]|uniref:uncharacterized protein n=1 Tax=Macrobrachium rosenbergii TaxID=79674 RepID=UPI0034D5ABF2
MQAEREREDREKRERAVEEEREREREMELQMSFLITEKVASGMGWPEDKWSVLLQSVLTGKGSANLALSADRCKDYKDVMNLLGVKQQLSTAYYPENQGALERFHQTLKRRDWDAGLPLMLFEVRNAYQESTGCSPNEMIFGREVRGPWKILAAENWEENHEEIQGEYVKNLRKRLREIRKSENKSRENEKKIRC